MLLPSQMFTFKISQFFFKDFIYLFMRDREIQAEGEAGSMQGACRGTRSQLFRIRPWAAGSAKPLSHLGCPKLSRFLKVDIKCTTNRKKKLTNIIKNFFKIQIL